MKIFTEKQRFNQWWIYVIFGVTLAVMVIPVVINADTLLNDKAGKIAIIISFLSILLAVILLRMVTLHSRIDEKGVHYRFTPFHRKQYLVSWNEVSNVYVRKYNAITEYGGWGFRGNILRSSGKAYNVRGSQGIQIVFTNGKKMLIGTQKGVEAQRILEVYKSKFLKSSE